MPDSPNTINQRVGALEFPYAAEDVDDADKTITDPAQAIMLACFKAALNDELSAAFQKAAAGTPLAGQQLVADVWPGVPTGQMLKERKAGWPLLMLGRVGKAPWSELTLALDQRTQKWLLQLNLGPLDVAAAQRIGRILPRASALIQRVIRNRGHKAFLGGTLIWGDDFGNLSSIWLDDEESGPATVTGDDGGVVYYALTCQLTTTEISGDLGDLPDLIGATFTFGVGGGGNNDMVPGLVGAITGGDFNSDFNSDFRLLGT